MITPNPLAFAVLAAWPLVVWWLYTRFDPVRALIWSFLGAYLILPPRTVFDLPMVPDLDKDTATALAALVISTLMLRDGKSLIPRSLLARGLLLLFVLTPLMTVLTNPDPILILRAEDVPGMRPYDILATVATELMYVLPLFLARRDLATVAAMRCLLKALVVAGLVYSLPMLFEARISPQLNNWIYGYHQHDFSQSMRAGGFRPIVFMPHGLWMAFFALLCLLAAAVFLREGPAASRPKQLAVFLWLLGMLYICKSFGPMAYAMVGLVLVVLCPPRLQVLGAAGLAVLVIVYPLLRGLHLVPLSQILDFAYSLNAERGWSLEYRIINEEQLLARAAEKPLYGWGSYGRNLIRDLITGRMLTVPDGAWIIRIGSYGWLGYISQFGVLCLPLWLLLREACARGAVIAPEVAAIAVLMALNLTDLLPNATLVPLTWLMAGALLGQVEILAEARAARLAARGPRWQLVKSARRTVL